MDGHMANTQHDNRDRLPFVVVALPRTGSTLLTSLLNSHPRITCHNEPFNPDAVYAAYPVLKNIYMRAYRYRDPVRFADFLFAEGNESRIVGFKLLDYQAKEVCDHLLSRQDVRKIVLKRANLLASYSSNHIAMKTRKWTVRRDGGEEMAAIEFDPRLFHGYVRKAHRYYDHIEEVIARSNSQAIDLEYRDLLDSDTHRRLLEFLRVDPSNTLHSDVHKQNPGRMEDRFLNWDCVVGTLSGTNMEEWLDTDAA